jgi:hypothetical protein
MEVVGVQYAGPGPADRSSDLRGIEAPTQKADRSAPATDRPRVPVEQLCLLAQVLPDEPQQILDRALLAAGRAVAVVQDKNHARCAPRAHMHDKLL